MINRIRELRIKKGISMKEAARLLSMPYTTYVNYEKGTREPNSETLILLSEFFGVSVDYLIGNEQAQTDNPELDEILEQMKTRPEMRMLFKLSANATAEDVRQAIRIIEAIRKEE